MQDQHGKMPCFKNFSSRYKVVKVYRFTKKFFLGVDIFWIKYKKPFFYATGIKEEYLLMRLLFSKYRHLAKFGKSAANHLISV